VCIRGVQIWGVRSVLCSGFSEKDKEKDFPEIMKKKLSKIITQVLKLQKL
jgi:hypothetical protein